MVDYMAAIETHHVGMEITMSDCCDYATIDWNGNTPILQTQLDDEWLEIYKTSKIIAMSVQAEADIVDGFTSEALGLAFIYTYDSTPEDQLNLLGSAAAGDDTYYATRIDGVKNYVLHTNAQLVQVIQDGRDVKLGVLQIFNTKKQQILDASTEAEVDTITW